MRAKPRTPRCLSLNNQFVPNCMIVDISRPLSSSLQIELKDNGARINVLCAALKCANDDWPVLEARRNREEEVIELGQLAMGVQVHLWRQCLRAVVTSTLLWPTPPLPRLLDAAAQAQLSMWGPGQRRRERLSWNTETITRVITLPQYMELSLLFVRLGLVIDAAVKSFATDKHHPLTNLTIASLL
jgi:hypothetical protein